MALFNKYLDNVKTFLADDKSNVGLRELKWFSAEGSPLIKSYMGNEMVVNMNESVQPYTPATPKVLFDYDSNIIQALFGENSWKFEEITIGSHPDFKYLKHNETIKHHCVSMFLDIRGSTNLVAEYPLEKVRQLKDSILTLAIAVANEFGGHVQRLQGDGIFLQFVRKDSLPNNSVINALNTASLLTYFISGDFAEVLKGFNIKPLKIRTGIDFGANDTVLWSYYGIPQCCELTTTSLHTDLAAKLQSKASSNSILIGDNIQKVLDLDEDFYGMVKDKEGKPMYYISNKFKYRFYEFNWSKYLRTHPSIKKSYDGQNLEIYDSSIYISCTIIDTEGNSYSYYPNSSSIPKGSSIIFTLYQNSSKYFMKDFEAIEWKAINSGEEAKLANQLEHNFERTFHDKTICEANAGYLGHHYVECKIAHKRDPSKNKIITFPIFVH